MRARSLTFRLGAAALCAAMIALPRAKGGAADPYVIYSFSSMTGALAFVGKAGADALAAYEEYFNKSGGINGRPIHFVIEDTQTDPQIAMQLVTKEVQSSHPAFVLGPTFAASCNAVFTVTKSSGPVTWCYSSAVSAEPGSFDFQTSATNYDYSKAAIRWLRSRGLTKVALITPTDATGQTYDRALAKILALPENRSVRLVAEEHFNASDISVAAQISHVRASGAQVLIVGTAGSAAGTVFHALADAGLTLPVVTGNGNASQAFMKQYAAILPKELYVESTQCLAPAAIAGKAEEAVYRTYEAAMRARNVPVDCLQSLAWDPALILTSALRHLGANASAEQIRAYVANLTNFPGVNGTYDFKRVPQRGLDDQAVVIARWDERKQAWVPASKPGGAPL